MLAGTAGLLSMKIPIENPIVHLNLPSGKGKSTAGYVAASTAGKPFDGTMTAVDEDGKVVEKLSLYQSWGATDNAMVETQAGNRAQVVTFLYRAMKKPAYTVTESGFTDVTDPEKFYYDAVLWAVENGITKGLSATAFGVDAICNRAQVVTFLYRAKT